MSNLVVDWKLFEAYPVMYSTWKNMYTSYYYATVVKNKRCNYNIIVVWQIRFK